MQMNVQLHHVVRDIPGLTGIRIIRAIVSDNHAPEQLAEFRDVRCHASEDTIREALMGNYRPEHVFALRQALELYDFHQAKVAECDVEIEAVLCGLNEQRVTSEVRSRPFVMEGPERAEVRCVPRAVHVGRRPESNPWIRSVHEEDLVDQLFSYSENCLARVLLLLARYGKQNAPERVVTKFSQATLAEMVGTTRSRESLHEQVQTAEVYRLHREVSSDLTINNLLLNVVLHD